MSLHAIKGTITAIGQSRFDNDVTIYAYLDITDPSGRRTRVEKVAVCNDVGSFLQLGLEGEFFVDRLFRYSQSFRCQLWALKTANHDIIDSKDLRKRLAGIRLLLGIGLLPEFGIGLLCIGSSLFHFANSIIESRQRMFYGSGPTRLAFEQRAVRI
jgi:hypothetical protein